MRRRPLLVRAFATALILTMALVVSMLATSPERHAIWAASHQI
jgi:hypothetical protein